MNVRLRDVSVRGVDQALRAVSLCAPAGEVVGVIGDATGRSIVRTIAGWHVPRTGELYVGGEDTTGLSPQLLRELGVVVVDDLDATGVEPPAAGPDDAAALAAVSAALSCSPCVVLADGLGARTTADAYLECLAMLRGAGHRHGTVSLLAEAVGADHRSYDRAYQAGRGRIRPWPQ